MFDTEFSGTKEKFGELWANLSDQKKYCLNWLTRQKHIVKQSLAKVDFLLRGGNDLDQPTCHAAESVITISASDRLMMPCYHSQFSIIPIGEKGLLAALESKERLECLGQSGRYYFCDGCKVWCNIVPSIAYSLSNPALQRLVICGTRRMSATMET